MSRRKGFRLPSFVPIDRRMLLHSPEWADLSLASKVLYLQIKAKHTGYNNGDLRLHYSEAERIMSAGTIARRFKELETKGWIERTPVGGKYRWVNDIRLTGKYDKTVQDYVGKK